MTTTVISSNNVITAQIEQIEIKQQAKQWYIFVAQLHDGQSLLVLLLILLSELQQLTADTILLFPNHFRSTVLLVSNQ